MHTYPFINLMTYASDTISSEKMKKNTNNLKHRKNAIISIVSL